MKVLFVSHNSDLSGANKSLLSNILSLREKVDITVLVNSKNGELQKELDKWNVEYAYLPYEWWVAHSRSKFIKGIYRFSLDFFKYYFMKFKKIFYKNEIDFSNFDLIYTNTSTVDIGAIISNKYKIPHIWHIREFGDSDFGFIPLTSKSYRKKIFNKASKLIFVSKALSKKYRCISSNKKSVIYNGFDIEKLIYTKTKCPQNFTNILVTGQVSPSKGQLQAIQAVSNLRKRGYSINLTLAGNIDKDYLSSVLDDMESTTSWLHVLGPVNDMYSLRSNMDIELVCSRSEAFGRVTIEAMLHSIPVIGAKTGGTPELITNEENGLLFSYGNIGELEIRIEQIINSSSLRMKIQENAMEFAKKFTIENTVDNILNQFNNVVKKVG